MSARKPEGWLFTDCWSGAHKKCIAVASLEPRFPDDYCTCPCHEDPLPSSDEMEALRSAAEVEP